MKKGLKIIGIILVSLIGIIIIIFLVFSARKGKAAKELYAQLGEEAPELTVDGYTFRDLNKNGSLDVYEDSRAGLEERVEDLRRIAAGLARGADEPEHVHALARPLVVREQPDAVLVAVTHGADSVHGTLSLVVVGVM